MNCRRSITLLFCYLAFICVKSQQLRFKYLTSEEGISTNFVNCIIQDKKGFIWVGTQDGLNKYNGFEFKVFKNYITDSSSLNISDVISMRQINNNLILLGTKEKLLFFDPITEKIDKLQNSEILNESPINAIYDIDSDNALIGTDEGIYVVNVKIHKVTTSCFSEKERMGVKSIMRCGNKIYFGTKDNGLWKLDNGYKPSKIKLINKYKLKTENENQITINHIEEYNSHVFLGTHGSGVFEMESEDTIKNIIQFDDDEAANFINDFKINGEKLYVATEAGFRVYDLRTNYSLNFSTKKNFFSTNAKQTKCLFVDSHKNFWVGTQLGGLNVAFSRSLKFPVSPSNYETQYKNIFSFCEIDSNNFFIGGVKTFHELNLQTGETTNHSSFLKNGTALCIARESKDVYWVGTWGNGLFRYDIKNKEAKNILGDALGGTIVSLIIVEGNVLAGSIEDGLFKIDLKTLDINRYTKKDGLTSESVNCFYKDKKGNLWIGTYGGGLIRMRGSNFHAKLPIEKVFKSSGNKNQLCSNIIYGINEDDKGNIWTATSLGLSNLSIKGNFINYTEKDGLANSTLYSVLKDKLGNFWMSSNRGIIYFNPNQKNEKIEFKNLSAKDGLVNSEFSMGAAHISTSGKIYFGGTEGFNSFHASRINDDNKPSPAIIIAYKRDGRDVITDSLIEYKRNLNLSWRENYFQFEFLSLDFSDPANNTFSYILEGYDKDWSTPSKVRFASYTGLPEGNYKFRVKTANSLGVWSEQIHELYLSISPPFWKTWWFRVTVTIIVIGTIWYYIKSRERKLMIEKLRLERIVEERTAQVVEQKHVIEEKHKEITDSINYAERIQRSFMATKEILDRNLMDYFVMFKPKDVVSGDFYWANKLSNNNFALVTADSTGHGVPGAIMSLLNITSLEKAVETAVLPSEILNITRNTIIQRLKNDGSAEGGRDGMDASITVYDFKNKKIIVSAANNPVWIVRGMEVIEIKPDKMPVGRHDMDKVSFTQQELDLQTGDVIYTLTDGFPDQFGGVNGKKFMSRNLRELLTNNAHLPMYEQKELLENTFANWLGDLEQVDDVTIIGVKV